MVVFYLQQKIHQTHLGFSENNTPLAILLQDRFPTDCVIRRCHVNSLFSELSSTKPERFEQCSKIETPDCRIIGWYNGLCCIRMYRRDFLLLNPSTRKSHTLPHVVNKDDDCIKYVIVRMEGFGYDEANDDYNVLALLEIEYAGRSLPGYVLRIYSLNSNSWKTLKHLLRLDRTIKPGVLVNGKLHWATKCTDSFPVLKYFSFDLGTRTFGQFELPSFVKVGHCYGYPTMGVIQQGCLTLLCNDRKYGFGVWVMKEYGVNDSWCRVVTLPYLRENLNYRFKLVCISEDGNVMLHQGSRLYIYDAKTKSARQIKLSPFDWTKGIGLCVESLVSPIPEGKKLN